MTIQRFLFAFLALGCGVSGAFAQYSTTTTGSAAPYTPQINFPPVGLATTETAQINVANLAANSSSGTAASCTGTITFIDAAGATVGSASTFTVTAAQTYSASLPYTSTGSAGRTVIRGQVTWTAPTSSTSAPCNLQASFETYDTSSGVTHLLLGGAGGAQGGFGGPGGH